MFGKRLGVIPPRPVLCLPFYKQGGGLKVRFIAIARRGVGFYTPSCDAFSLERK